MCGDAVEHAISYWVIFEKFRSPALGGFAMLSHWLPWLFFSVWSGGLADRHDPRRMIQAGLVIFMLASLAWAALIFSDSLEMWHAAVILVIHGLAGVTWGPAALVLIHDVLDAPRLHSGIRLNATARYLGLLLGPAIGAAFLIVLGAAWGLLLNVFLYVPFFIWLQKHQFPRTRASARRIRGVAEIFQTIREVARDRVLVSMTLLAGSASFLIGNAYQPQIPEFATDLGHGQADGGIAYGALLAADAAGALTAGLVLESRNLLKASPRSAIVLALLWCVAIAGFAMSTSYPLALILLFVAGFFDLAFFAMAQTLVQLRARPENRGQVIGLFVMAALGLRAFGGVTVGLGGSIVGIHWSLALSAVLLFVVVAAIGAFSRRRPAAQY